MIQVKKPTRLNISKSQKPSVQLKEKRTHFTHMPFRSWCTVCQRAKGQQHYHKSKQKASSVIQLDHSFYKIHGEAQKISKCSLFVETITSISGAVIVPDCVSQSCSCQSPQEVHLQSMDWIHQVCSSMWWSFRTSSTSRTSRLWYVTSYSSQSSI